MTPGFSKLFDPIELPSDTGVLLVPAQVIKHCASAKIVSECNKSCGGYSGHEVA